MDENRKIILFHEIRYMGSILFIYVLLFTFFFCLVTAFHYVLARKNEKINEIYRCYTANVSHELKSPITSIQAVTSALNEGLVEDEETRRRYYGIIYREARQLEYTVQDILELSKIQEHRIDMAKGKVDGKELLMDICQKYRECCEEMDICFKAPEWTEKFPSLMLLTNADRIRQVLDILFDNAVKFLPEDREGQIELDVEIRRKKALISLKDNGIGIPESDLSHVFERFYRSRKNSSIKGTGLGLAIAKEIMTELHEQIGVESIEDVGTRFYFSVERV